MNDKPGANERRQEGLQSDSLARAASIESFAGLELGKDGYTDGREPGDWETKYPPRARKCINQESCFLAILLCLFVFLAGISLGLSNAEIHLPIRLDVQLFATSAGTAPAAVQPLMFVTEFRLLALFFVGCLGGTTFSIKWLLHSTAKGRWHLDRRYWRCFVPFLGGVYACVVLTLLDAGLVGGSQAIPEPRPIAIAAALAFLVGYFSDGVSGLLSNIANAVFGTLEKK